MRSCERCDEPPKFLLYAAYDAGSDEVHPKVARYPFAMFGACVGHVADLLTADSDTPGATHQWVVKLHHSGGQEPTT